MCVVRLIRAVQRGPGPVQPTGFAPAIGCAGAGGPTPPGYPAGMYASFFGLKQSPFSIAPDPRYLYMSERHREALAHLLYGVQGGGGFVLLSGEIGAGKTTVCRCFLEQVPVGCQVAYIFNPQLTVIELLQTVCDEFGIVVAPGTGTGPVTVKTFVDALNAHLLAAHAQGRHCVLIIDEAQHLSAEVLEQLRLLTNLETSERKLLQIMLIGQPELRSLLAGPGLEQLAQRVIARYHLGPLSAAETAAYVAHRLAVAGLSGAMPFDPAALRRIHSLTGGVPRRINLLCDRALLGAFAEGQARVGQRIVDRAASEVFDTGVPPRRGRRWPLVAGGAAAGLAVAVLLAGAGWAWWGSGRGAVGVAGVAGAASAASAAALAARATASAPVAGAVATAASAASAALSPSAAGGQLLAAPAASAAPTSLPASAANGTTAATAATASSATATATVASAPTATDAPLLPVPGLAVFPSDEQRAWRDLAPLWGWQVPAGLVGELCQQARAQQLRCFRTATGTLAQLRQLDRPVLLMLRGDDGPPHLARLLALDGRRAVLAAGAQAYSLPLDDLARFWRGEFSTFWRAPEAYTRLLVPGAQGPAVDTLAQGLAAARQQPPPPAGQVLAEALSAQLSAFQQAQGLKPDGIAGPTTFMQLNRVLGVAEPRLATLAPER